MLALRTLCAALLLMLGHADIAHAAEAPARRPIIDFAALPALEAPSLSPDGRKIATKIARDGKQYLAVLNFDGAPPVFIANGDNDLNWWRWVNNDWLVVGIGNQIPFQGDEMYIRRAVAVSADGKTLNKLAFSDAAQMADDVIWTARDGSPRILLAVQKSVYLGADFWPVVMEYDVSTGKGRRVAGPYEGVMDWYADGAGNVRMGIGSSTDGRNVRLLYREGGRGSFRTVDRANRRRDEHLTVPALFLPEPGRALAIADDDDGFGTLYELDLATLALGKPVHAAKGFDIGGLRVDPTGYRATGVSVTGDWHRIHWLDPELAKVQAEIDKAVGDRRATIVSMSADQMSLLVYLGAPDQAGAYYIYDRADGVMRHVAWTNNVLKGTRFHPVRTIRYKARDGLEIAAVLTTPKTHVAGTALPLIVMPHGGPFARDEESWDWWAQFLADRGYLVVQPNYRGSSGYGTEFTKMGEGQWGLAMQDDLNDAVDALAKLGLADPKRVCMVGGSYGGYAALRAAQRDGARYRCAAAFAGVSDLPRLRRYDSRFLMSGARSDWLRTQAPDLRSVSPLNYPADFTIPVLMVHGRKDTRVPVAHSREMAEKLRKAKKDVVYIEQREGDHHLSLQADRIQFLEQLEAFLTKHNPA
jgi:dipeptidyl aminopeptidase/acylaminoacyl peptidase